MAESKRTGLKGTMNKDLDDRLIPEGFYRDALNITVGHSEGSDVGAVENLRGNGLVAGTAQDGIDGTVIGTTIDSETGYIYYFVTETDSDTIYEYNPDDDTLSIVIRDERPPGDTTPEEEETGGDGGGDSGGGGGGDPAPTVNWTLSISSFTLSDIPVSQTLGSQTYKISAAVSATSTSDQSPPQTRTISTYHFQETDSAGTVLSSQPGPNFGNASNTLSTVETSTVGRSAATRYFKVTVTDSGGETATATASITIPAGTPALSGSASGPGTVTEGGSISLSVSASGGIPGYSYSWSGPNGFSSSSQNPSVTSNASSVHAGTYSCVITDSASPANSITRSTSVSVTVFGTPSVTTVSVSAETVNSLQFNGSVTHGGNPGTVTSRGFYYLKNTTGTTHAKSTIISQGTKVTEPSGTGNGGYYIVQTGLDSGSIYDIVAWAYNGSNEGTGGVQSGETSPAGERSIVANPVSLGDKPAASQTYVVDLTLNNLPNSLLNTSTSYITGGTGWISSVTRRTGTNTYDITFAAMTAQTSTSPTKRIANITFTNPTTGTTGSLSCSQTLGASISITSAMSGGATSFQKTGGVFGAHVAVAFDPANNVLGQWSFYDTLPSWITPTPNSSYLGSITAPSAVNFTLANNNSGGARNHTFDVRINDTNATDPNNWVRDTLTISQNNDVIPLLYEFGNYTHSQKTGIIFWKSNGSFHDNTFRASTQGQNTRDATLRMTAAPTGTNASEITSIQYYLSPQTGEYNSAHFSMNGTLMQQSQWTNVHPSSIPQQGGSFNLTITAPSSFTPQYGGDYTQIQVIKTLTIRATSSSGHTATHQVSLSRTQS